MSYQGTCSPFFFADYPILLIFEVIFPTRVREGVKFLLYAETLNKKLII